MSKSGKQQRPPGPSGSWPLGNTQQFAAGTLAFVHECMEAYDKVAYARIAFRDFFILLHPDPIDYVLRQKHRNYEKSFAYDGLKTILGNGLLTSEGDFWRKQRRLAQPAFHRSALKGLGELMAAQTQELILRWKQLPDGSEIDVGAEMLGLTRKILTQALFGTDQKIPESEKIGEMLPILRQYANDKMKNPLKAPLWVPNRNNRKFKAALSTLDRIFAGIIQSFEKIEPAKRPNCLLGMLMATEDADTGEKMSPQQLRDEIITLYLAGQETTTNSLSFLFYLLAKNPSETAKIQQEIRNPKPHETQETDQSQEALRNAINETLRLYPPAWAVSREATKDDQLEGYSIPQGAVMFVSIYALHHSPQWWEQPESFLPDRWKEPLKDKRVYLPFGTGPRICIGNHFALMEMQIIMAMVIREFNWELASNEPLELITPMTLSPKAPVRVRIQAVPPGGSAISRPRGEA